MMIYVELDLLSVKVKFTSKYILMGIILKMILITVENYIHVIVLTENG